MINSLKAFFQQHFDELQQQPGHDPVPLATATLLAEIMLQDDVWDRQELAACLKILQQQHGLSKTEAEVLLDSGKQSALQAVDYHQFTSLLNKEFDQEQKIRLIENLWQLAYADKRLDKYEEHAIRKIADLLYVSHSDFIAAKHRVEAES